MVLTCSPLVGAEVLAVGQKWCQVQTWTWLTGSQNMLSDRTKSVLLFFLQLNAS